jgi:hypothetical protein
VKLERLRDLLVPVLENPSQAGEVHWTGVKVHGWLKEQLELEVGYSTTCAISMSSATICVCRGLGLSGRMKPSAAPS